MYIKGSQVILSIRICEDRFCLGNQIIEEPDEMPFNLGLDYVSWNSFRDFHHLIDTEITQGNI